LIKWIGRVENSMTKETRKQSKAVENIRKAIRKAVDKGVSQTVVEDTVNTAMAKATDIDPDASEPVGEVKSKVKKIPGLHKTGDITLKRGMAVNPMKPDSEKPSLKKLPGKTKPPTLTLKRGKNS